ncbi:heavy metal-responsive transcriptional regulator [Amycolatopsis saalfeldensis]|uniref:DNA-binding transcriptional regulator, MerR family n=1 Tax=Amycolatopsis saalfeldensis TaxID=394193 RepID=A0A1H8YMG7_9PSEU|nr:heavy metal-responsive transcriptional regulator [Amycolatopsis saalfeldensis]SEP53346.1 DNA-binding transcriptional regulator, MerR family [Amycolatopsis saalfeldensis]
MKISELAAASGTTTKTIRFYEQAGVLPEPIRTPSGYRDYSPEFIDRLGFIRRAQAAGLTLREVGQILAIRDRGDAPCGHVRHVLSDRLDQVRAQIAELVTLESHLGALLAHAQQGEPTEHDNATVCWILETEPGARTDAAEGSPRHQQNHPITVSSAD